MLHTPVKCNTFENLSRGAMTMLASPLSQIDVGSTFFHGCLQLFLQYRNDMMLSLRCNM